MVKTITVNNYHYNTLCDGNFPYNDQLYRPDAQAPSVHHRIWTNGCYLLQKITIELCVYSWDDETIEDEYAVFNISKLKYPASDIQTGDAIRYNVYGVALGDLTLMDDEDLPAGFEHPIRIRYYYVQYDTTSEKFSDSLGDLYIDQVYLDSLPYKLVNVGGVNHKINFIASGGADINTSSELPGESTVQKSSVKNFSLNRENFLQGTNLAYAFSDDYTSSHLMYPADLQNNNSIIYTATDFNWLDVYQFLSRNYEIFAVDFYVDSTENGIFTVKPRDLRGIPSPYTSASYNVMWSYYANPDSINDTYGYEAWKTVKSFSLSWDDMYTALDAVDRNNVDRIGYIPAYLRICRVDSNGGWIYDLTGRVRFHLDGTMEDVTTDPGVFIHFNEDPDGNDEFPDDNAYNDEQVPGQEMSVDNLLSSSYVLTEEALRKFGIWLWANNLQDSLYELQTAPIENVLSCKRIPFAVPGHDARIKCGNLVTNVGWDIDASDYDGTVQLANCDHKQPIGEIQIPTYHTAEKGSYLDMQNNISIYLPYCGIHTIPTGLCYKQLKDSDGLPYLTGRTLKVDYFFDIVYGSCAAVLYLDDIMFATYNGDCGVDIPVTASNRASNQLALKTAGDNMVAGMATALIPGLASGAAMSGGNPLGMILGALMGASVAGMNSLGNMEVMEANQQIHFTTAGGFSSQIASFLPSDVTLFIDHVIAKRPSTYAHDNGFPCNLSYKLSDLKGYTEISGACDIKGIPCLEDERKAIKAALMEGFYL